MMRVTNALGERFAQRGFDVGEVEVHGTDAVIWDYPHAVTDDLVSAVKELLPHAERVYVMAPGAVIA